MKREILLLYFSFLQAVQAGGWTKVLRNQTFLYFQDDNCRMQLIVLVELITNRDLICFLYRVGCRSCENQCGRVNLREIQGVDRQKL